METNSTSLYVKKLVSEIKQASDSYYRIVDGQTSVSDLEFDRLIEDLKIADPNNKTLRSVGWGFTVNAKNKLQHKKFITGIDNKIKWEEEAHFSEGDSITHKLDGSSCVLCYGHDGRFVSAISRGDGVHGQDISKAVMMSGSIPNKISCGSELIRGEIVMSLESFEKLEDKYSSARNAATGISQSDNIEMYQYIEFVACSVIKTRVGDKKTYSENMTSLIQDGFLTVGWDRVCNVSLYSLVHDKYNTYDDLYKKAVVGSESLYLCDGAVVMQGVQDQPNGDVDYLLMAIKYKNKTVQAKVVDVEWSCSEHGRLIPVIVYESVVLGGAECSRCSGFNAKAVWDNGIGEGAVINLFRSGEVIPHWDSTEKSTGCDLPEFWDGKQAHWDGVHLRVEVDKERFMVRSLLLDNCVLGVAGVVVDLLIEKLEVYTFKRLQEVSSMDALYLHSVLGGGVYAEKMVESIRLLLETPRDLSYVMMFSNVDSLGEASALSIAESTTLSELVGCLKEHNKFPKLVEENMPTYVPNEDVKNCSKSVVSLLEFPFCWADYKKDDRSIVFRVCLTGALSRPRKKLLEDWKDYGVSECKIGEAEYLICPGPSSSSKYKTAIKRGIKILTEQEFVEHTLKPQETKDELK